MVQLYPVERHQRPGGGGRGSSTNVSTTNLIAVSAAEKRNMPICVPSCTAEPSSPASEPAWEVLLHRSWLPLGRPAQDASDSNCAIFLESRLDLCERGRALAAARNAPRVTQSPTKTRQKPEAFLARSWTPYCLPPPRFRHASVNRDHWACAPSTGTIAAPRPGHANPFSLVIASTSNATLLDAVLQDLRAGQGTSLANPTGGHRPLLMMSFMHRLGLGAVIGANSPSAYGSSRPTAALWVARMEPTR